ncbi:MAG: T9SS type A sorting domain-containing protein [Flavobacteriales bacterium]|nr:T9SS type A sorting domain-containing protein [Flavobacteriales bacterium]
MKRSILASLSVLALTSLVSAQQPTLCGTDQERARLIAQDPTYLEREAAFQQELRELIMASRAQRDDDQVYRIPVVFHVLHLRGQENITNEQIYDAVSILNRDYNAANPDSSLIVPAFQDLFTDMDIEFRLATIDPIGHCTNGIVRHQSVETFRGGETSKLTPWPRNRYLNIWVTKQIGSGAAGYFTYGSWSVLDGIMILQDYVGSIGTSGTFVSRALTHEVGHYLSLAHVWGTNNGVPENAPPGHMQEVCGDDGVDDTPLTRGWNCCPGSTCGSIAPTANDANDCDSTILENFQNYMEYSYCSRMFTDGQRERARSALNSPTYQRNLLWTSYNLESTGTAEGFQQLCPPEADFYAQVGTSPAQPAIPFPPMSCDNTTVRFYDNSARADVESWSWTFQDGNPATSSVRNPTVQFTGGGWKTVSLTVSNAQGSSSKTDPYAVYIGTPDVAATPYFESFEDMQGTNLYPYVGFNYENNHTAFFRFTGGGATGNACVMLNSGDRNQLDFIDPDNAGDYDDFVTPLLNLTGASSGTFSFRYAYSTNTADIANVTERLEVESSFDCGRTWQTRGTITGTALLTNGNNNSLPPAEWKLKTYTLPGSLLANDVRFRFRFISSAYSGHFFIDDIWIGVPVGMQDLINEGFITLYPNPTTGAFTLQVIGMESSSTEVTITDLRGAVVYQDKFQPNGGAPIEIDGRGIGLAEGLYMVRASNNTGSSVQKLMIGR